MRTIKYFIFNSSIGYNIKESLSGKWLGQKAFISSFMKFDRFINAHQKKNCLPNLFYRPNLFGIVSSFYKLKKI